MKKTVLQSTVILVIVSVIAKALSFIVRIMLARTLSPSAMNYYTLAAPTMVFFITLAQMGIPGALSKVIAQSDHPHQPLKVSVILSLLNNAVIILTFLLVLPFLATRILKQKEILPVLYAIIPLIPLVSLSGILKGYLFGLQHHVQATSSQLFEEGSRILFLFVVFYLHPFTDAITMARIAMLSVSVGEACSALFMLISLRRQKRTLSRIPRLFSDLNRRQFDEVLTVSIPMTGSRLIGSLTYFMEPIVMVLGLGTAASAAMVGAYGQLNGYVLPIITMPSFITVTLSNFLLPSFTYSLFQRVLRSCTPSFFDDHRLLLSGRSGLQCDLLSVSGAAALSVLSQHPRCPAAQAAGHPVCFVFPAASPVQHAPCLILKQADRRRHPERLSGTDLMCAVSDQNLHGGLFAHCTDSRDAHYNHHARCPPVHRLQEQLKEGILGIHFLLDDKHAVVLINAQKHIIHTLHALTLQGVFQPFLIP